METKMQQKIKLGKGRDRPIINERTGKEFLDIRQIEFESKPYVYRAIQTGIETKKDKW